MKLNHLNLPVPDVAETQTFFEKYFNFTRTEVKVEHALTVLKGEDGFTLVLMSEAFNRNGNAAYPDALHIGFLVEDSAQVDAMFNRLTEDGLSVPHKPGNRRGVHVFYFHAPGNILTEVSTSS